MTPRPRVMPHLRKVWNIRGFYEWACSDTSSCYAYGWGPTREAAYEAWLTMFARCRRALDE